MKSNILIRIAAVLTGILSVIDCKAQDTIFVGEVRNPPLRKVEVGARFMPTVNDFTLKDYRGEEISGRGNISIGYGGFIAYNITSNIGIHGEINYNAVTQNYKDKGLDRTVDINYLNLPLMLSLNTDKSRAINLNVHGGPQFGINAGSKLTRGNARGTDTLNAVLALKPADLGLAYGAGLEFALNDSHTIRFDVGYRGAYGLIDIRDTKIGNDSYNVVVKGSRKYHSGYAGLTLMF